MSNTKTEITMFALGLVTRKNFSSFSYDDISRAFNITKAAVHYYFKSKEDLGVAICELLRDKLVAMRDAEVEAARKGRHPWLYIESQAKSLPPGGICPIVSMQADFENLPDELRAALTDVTAAEVENLRLIARAYDEKADEGRVVILLLGLKGALQYRRVMGEKFFREAVKNIKTQFYEMIPKRA